MLTNEDVKALCERFKPGQHGFLPYGGHKPYIEEFAITSRLDKVDPSWEWNFVSSNQRENQLVYVGTLTIKGVTRFGVGMQAILTNDKEEEINEPEKSAATDALKRAARLFGVGRYLLVAPDSVQNQQTLEAWFSKIDRQRQSAAIESGDSVEETNEEAKPTPNTGTGKPPRTPAQSESSNGNGETVTPPKWWKAVTSDKELVKLAGSQELLAALLKDALKEGKIKPDDSVQMATDFARTLATADIPF